MSDLPLKEEPKKDTTAVEINQGNVGVLTVKLLNEILNQLKRIGDLIEKNSQA